MNKEGHVFEFSLNIPMVPFHQFDLKESCAVLLLSLERRIHILSFLTCLQFRLKSQFEWEEHYKLQNTIFETSDC